MSYNRIAILVDLRTQLDNEHCEPSHSLAERAGQLLSDDTYKKFLHTIGDRRPLRAAVLWSRIAEQLNGQHRIEALTLAAVFALKANNPAISAQLISRVDIATRRDHSETPAMLDILKLDHRVRDHLPHPVA